MKIETEKAWVRQPVSQFFGIVQFVQFVQFSRSGAWTGDAIHEAILTNGNRNRPDNDVFPPIPAGWSLHDGSGIIRALPHANKKSMR